MLTTMWTVTECFKLWLTVRFYADFMPILSRFYADCRDFLGLGFQGTGDVKTSHPGPFRGKMLKSCPGPFWAGAIFDLVLFSLSPGTMKGHLSCCAFVPGQKHYLVPLSWDKLFSPGTSWDQTTF